MEFGQRWIWDRRIYETVTPTQRWNPPLRTLRLTVVTQLETSHVLRRELFLQYASDTLCGKLQIIFEPKAVANATFFEVVVGRGKVEFWAPPPYCVCQVGPMGLGRPPLHSPSHQQQIHIHT
jgi:hypothetical protein